MPLPAFPAISSSHVLLRIPMFNTNVLSYGSKVEQRICLDPDPQWKLKLRFNKKSPALADQIIDFFIARKGKHESFTIPDEKGTVYTARFAEDSINIEYFSYMLYNLGEVEFIEVAA